MYGNTPGDADGILAAENYDALKAMMENMQRRQTLPNMSQKGLLNVDQRKGSLSKKTKKEVTPQGDNDELLVGFDEDLLAGDRNRIDSIAILRDK